MFFFQQLGLFGGCFFFFFFFGFLIHKWFFFFVCVCVQVSTMYTCLTTALNMSSSGKRGIPDLSGEGGSTAVAAPACHKSAGGVVESARIRNASGGGGGGGVGGGGGQGAVADVDDTDATMKDHDHPHHKPLSAADYIKLINIRTGPEKKNLDCTVQRERKLTGVTLGSQARSWRWSWSWPSPCTTACSTSTTASPPARGSTRTACSRETSGSRGGA